MITNDYRYSLVDEEDLEKADTPAPVAEGADEEEGKTEEVI